MANTLQASKACTQWRRGYTDSRSGGHEGGWQNVMAPRPPTPCGPAPPGIMPASQNRTTTNNTRKVPLERQDGDPPR
eukprot:1105822-Pyramimonas_sp.AAC.1